MASESLVTEQFQFLGIEVKDEVLKKCVSLCEEYGVDAESLTEQWMAFSLNHLNGAAPTLDNLNSFARKEFSKRAANHLNAPAKDAVRSSTGSSLTVYGAPISGQSENDVLSNYMTATPKTVKVEPQATPAQNELRPATYSPSVNHSAKYASRTGQGSVVHSFGDNKLLERLLAPNGPGDVIDLNVAQVPNDDGELYNKPKFGFELLHEKASTFDSHIRYVTRCIMKKAAIAETASVRHKSQGEVFVAGRVECDADARLNPKSVVLQGTWEESLSQAVSLDLDNVKQYSLFPGQVVVARGANPRGDRFVASEVYSDAGFPAPDHSALNGTISLVAASGPYTTSDNMAYEPLKDFVAYVGSHKPHLAVLTGPFMDTDHVKVKDNSMAETYKAFFEKLVDSLGELSNTSPNTKIYVVASAKDAFHVNIFPTPAYTTRRKPTNVHFLPDPCTLNANGLIISVTSIDVLMHISQEEISLGVGGDKLSRLASHLLAQQSLYPLWPPPPSVATDAALWSAHAQLPAAPHVLITPSNFRYFIKEVNGTIVVNPEHLTKGTGGGTFARILLSADQQVKSIAAQIVRI